MSEVAVKEKEDVLIVSENIEKTIELKEIKKEYKVKKFKIYYIFKRLVDIVASSLALILLSPVYSK